MILIKSGTRVRLGLTHEGIRQVWILDGESKDKEGYVRESAVQPGF